MIGGHPIAVDLGDLWYVRCHFREGRRWIEEVLRVGKHASAALRMRVLRRGAHLAFWEREYDLAVAFAQESLRLARESGDNQEIGDSLMMLASSLQDLEIHEPTFSSEARIIEQFLAPACAQLDAHAWEAAWNAGKRMTFERRLTLALRKLRAT